MAAVSTTCMKNRSVDEIRVIQRERQKYFRRQRKDDVFNQNRERYSEVENSFKYISVDEMRDLALNLKNTKDSTIVHQITKAASFGNEHIEAFFKVYGALNTLVGILCGRDAENQLEAAACLTNLACGPHKSTQKLAKAAGAYLVSYMKSDSHFLQDQCAWAAGNIANDCDKCCSLLSAQGLFPALESLLQSPYPEVIQSATFALSMSTRYESPELTNMVQANLTSSLINCLTKEDISRQAFIDVMYALANVCSLTSIHCLSEQKQMELGSSIMFQLGQAVLKDDIDVLIATPAVRCLGGLSAGSTELCTFIIGHESFDRCIRQIMTSQCHHLKKETMWVLTNLLVSCGSSESLVDWLWIVEISRCLLSPLDESAVQVLYFLCVLLTLKPGLSELLKKDDSMVSQVQTLCNCGKEELEISSKTLLSILSTV